MDLDILMHERLKNPVESLCHSIKTLSTISMHVLFSSQLPSSTDIGLL